MTLDAAELDAITQEARNCFLYEDAPEYLLRLEQWAEQVAADPERPYTPAEYNVLMRAAHSLKGGAGIAQLPELQALTHHLEDVLEALKENQIGDRARAHQLLLRGIEQTHELLEAAKQQRSVTITPEHKALLADLAALLGMTAPASIPSGDLQTALRQDLEACLQALEASTTDPERETAFIALAATAQTIGDRHQVPWLKQLAAELPNLVAEMSLAELVPAVVAEFRQLQQEELAKLAAAASAPPPASAPAEEVYLRIPVSKLDRLGNTVSELLIGQERLTLYQQQFARTNRELKHRIEQFRPIRDQVQTFYDRLATPLAGRGVMLNGHDTTEFDALQFDRYTELHTTLQDFQELLARIQETGADIDLLNRDLQEALDAGRQYLNTLYHELTDSRLVPFRQLAEKFITAVQTLGDRHAKPVQLLIEGGDTLVDQVILQQLKAPLTHLVRNAFDHGLEPSQERTAKGKPAVGTITLRARLRGNAVEIQVADDGRGIDLQRVCQKAVELNLCPIEKMPELNREQILEFLFLPGFSTAKQVSDLSGRGVGLDVVRAQVERSRGSIKVTTEPQQGTTFTLSLPLTLSILPMVLCQVGDLTLAIPDLSIREVIALKEYTDIREPSRTITWQEQTVPLYPLHRFLPYQRPITPPSQPLGVGVVVEVDDQPIVLAVNYLIAERELVVKPFDQTVPVPPYIMGCTVLGSGEVVPVLAPDNLTALLGTASVAPAAAQTARTTIPPQPRRTPQVMVVDDSIAVRRLLDRVLRQAGYEVVQCRDGKEALDILLGQGQEVALVITDVEMPRLDGYGLLEAIRTADSLQHLPVTMLTSRGGDRHRQKAFQLGANGYITKPFQPQAMLETVAQLLGQR